MNMTKRKNEARRERQQHKIDEGSVAEHYPGVEKIEISMVYHQKNLSKSLNRVVNFTPASYAFFNIDCLSNNCVEGGFDLSHVITSMISNQSKTSKGDLSCEGNHPAACDSAINYEVTIKYS